MTHCLMHGCWSGLEKLPDKVRIQCNGIYAMLRFAKKPYVLTEDGREVSPTAFESEAGCAGNKKWKCSFKVVENGSHKKNWKSVKQSYGECIKQRYGKVKLDLEKHNGQGEPELEFVCSVCIEMSV